MSCSCSRATIVLCAALLRAASPTVMPVWLCVLCEHRREHTAFVHLERQGFEAYLPKEPLRQTKSGKWTEQEAPIFPRYLFVRADMERQDLSVVRSTRGCIQILKFGQAPTIVPEAIIEEIRTTEQLLRLRHERNRGLLPGKSYELLEKNFEGHSARFVALSSHNRAQVLITLLNQEQMMSLPVTSLGAMVAD